MLSNYSIAGKDQGGGGGDIVFCRPTKREPVGSYQVLDFYLWRNQNGNNLNSLSKIIDKLKASAPSLGHDLENFVNSSPYPVGVKLTSNWLAKNQVNQVNDEELGSALEKMNKTPRFLLLRKKLPSHCKLKQAVLRTETPKGIVYEYDTSILDALSKDEVQLSYILIHEWLRNYFSSAEKIRRANWVFHHEGFLTSSSHTMYFTLCRLGFNCNNIEIKE